MRAVLACLAGASGPVWGLLVVRETGRPTGTVYPLLDRLERAGMLESHWDESPRPGARRRLYRLTPEGRQVAHQVQRDAVEQAVGERDAAKGLGRPGPGLSGAGA